jgi:hypothetical protein
MSIYKCTITYRGYRHYSNTVNLKPTYIQLDTGVPIKSQVLRQLGSRHVVGAHQVWKAQARGQAYL